MRRSHRLSLIAAAAALVSLVATSTVSARDDRLRFSIKDALGRATAKQKLDPSVALYFGKAAHPAAVEDKGDFKTNKKTRAAGRSDLDACEWAFLSAVMQLQERARALQANAVVEIESIYKDQPFASETEFECGAGSMVAGVALHGRFIKTAAK